MSAAPTGYLTHEALDDASALDPDVWPKVRTAFAEALGLDDDEVEPGHRIIEELDAESLDFLDIAFRLERAFDIKIPRAGVENASKEGIDPTDYEVDGVLTELALTKLKELMPEVPAEEFKPGLTSNDIPRLFRVQSFVNLVVGLLAEKAKA